MRWFITCLFCITVPLFSNVQAQPASHTKKHAITTKPKWNDTCTLTEFQKRHLRYPDAARANRGQGRVIVSFVIATNGNTTDVKVDRTSGFENLDAEAMRYVKSMPPWKPATINGKKIPYRFILPITFELQ